jgi:hypothetical protein
MLAHAIAVPADVDQVAAIQDPADQGGRHDVVA